MTNSKVKIHSSGDKGQAILELAVLGSIVLMLLGILISYGLRFNYQQKLTQQAYRKAMSSSFTNPLQRSNSYTVIKDVHIPSPVNPFGVGSVTPLSGSAGGITRSYDLAAYATDPDELPTINYVIQGVPYSFTTAGVRYEYNVPSASVDKYKEIYLSSNVQYKNGTEVEESSINYYGEDEFTYKQDLTILDPIMGQIVDYNLANGICSQIVDEDTCVSQCELAASSSNCADICSRDMNIPWYCEGGYKSSQTGRFVFPNIETMFSCLNLKTMGLQQDYGQETSIDNTLTKQESASAITTKDSLDWNVQTKRKIMTRPKDDTNPDNLVIQEPVTNVGQKEGEDKHTTATSW